MGLGRSNGASGRADALFRSVSGAAHPAIREAEIANVPFLGALAGCSARRSERRVASHTSEEQRRNAPGSAAKNGILAFSASLSRPRSGA